MFHSTAYVNGSVYTMEREGERCSAFVVQDGKFVYCGGDDAAKRLADEVVDLHGAAVLPGMIDTHQHLLAYASGLSKLNLKAARSLEQLKQMLRDYAKDVPAGEWILGVGFDNEKFEGSKAMPSRWDLDEACADHPVILSRYCLHFFSANSMALERGGIDRSYKPPVAGNVKYDERGEPNGVICDGAATRVLSIVPDKLASFEAKKEILVKALRQLNAYGLTGVHPIQGRHCDLMEYTDLYQALKDEGRLTARIYINYDELPGCSIRTGLGDELLRFGFYKSYMDGNLSGRTAFMLEPYSDAPDTAGVCNYDSQEAITARLREGYRRGMQIGVHAIGDRAADMLITAIETIYREEPHPDPRFRLIHMTTLNASLVERMSRLPVIVDVQPVFIPINVRSADSRMGDTERGAYTFAYKKMLDAGLMLTGGSDSPCDSFNPLDGVYAMVNRKDYTGYPEGGWHPQECIGVYDALRMYTYNAAYASFEEDIKGTIREGKLADFVVLDADVFKVDPMKIKDTWLALMVPVIILGGIYASVFTPTESAVVGIVYTLIVGIFVYKELTLATIYDALRESVLVNGQTMFLVGFSMGFARFLTMSQIPASIAAKIGGIDSKVIVFLMINLFLLIVGCFIDNISSMLILTPIFLPIVKSYGMDPIQFGIVMTVNLCIGFITPPYGANLFIASAISNVPIMNIAKKIMPMIGAMLVVLMLLTFIPALSTFAL